MRNKSRSFSQDSLLAFDSGAAALWDRDIEVLAICGLPTYPIWSALS